MKNNNIHIAIKDDQVKLTAQHTQSLEDIMIAMFTAMLGAMKSTLAAIPEANQEEAKNDLYDMMNNAASQTLAMFAPDLELRPNLTTQAILDAENKIIGELYDERQRTQRDVSILDLAKIRSERETK
jgi:hypothetical protein